MWRQRFFRVLLIAFALVQAEFFSRAYMSEFRGASFLDPSRTIYTYYPQLIAVERTEIEKEDAAIDVLLLGGSVLDQRWTNVPTSLAIALERASGRSVRIHNVSFKAHTSRDSYLKYKRLGSKPFDLVVFYHGINEARANNAPRDLYDPAYDHYSWYREVNILDRDPLTRYLALPFVVRLVGFALKDLVTSRQLVPRYEPTWEWTQYGGEVKTAGAFRSNLSAILNLAEERGQPVMAMTFAYYVAPGYSLEAFRSKTLDYRRHMFPIETWGIPENVVAALEAHNGVVRELAKDRPGVYFVDQARLMPSGKEYFNDVCHLTAVGSTRFAENMIEALPKTVLFRRQDAHP
jgi:hypothetical protein